MSTDALGHVNRVLIFVALAAFSGPLLIWAVEWGVELLDPWTRRLVWIGGAALVFLSAFDSWLIVSGFRPDSGDITGEVLATADMARISLVSLQVPLARTAYRHRHHPGVRLLVLGITTATVMTGVPDALYFNGSLGALAVLAGATHLMGWMTFVGAAIILRRELGRGLDRLTPTTVQRLVNILILSAALVIVTIGLDGGAHAYSGPYAWLSSTPWFVATFLIMVIGSYAVIRWVRGVQRDHAGRFEKR